MSFVTDPDDLDRFQVCVDPVGERVSIRGLGTERHALDATGDSDGSTTFTDAGANFTTDGVQVNDILTIVSDPDGDGNVIGHYVVATVGTTTLVVDRTIPASASANLSYKVNAPKATGGAAANVADGVTLQALYSFLKEEWRTLSGGLGNAPDLIQFLFPLESITSEQFEIGGATHSNWDFKDQTTKDLIRTGGWQQINSSGVVQKDYAGVITLGSLDSDAQVYYVQVAAGTPSNFVLTGAVNQAILTFTNGGDNFRTYLVLYVRKKARTYAQSAIADIGVSTIKTIVNRFPLTHANDPAIAETDGVLAGDSATSVFQNVTTVDSAKTDGVVSDPTAGDGLFRLVSAASLFQTTNKVRAGDTVQLTDGSDQGVYEISSVDSETQLTLLQEPGIAIVGGSGVDFTTRTRVRNDGATDGTTADPTPDDDLGTFTSATVGDFAAAGVVAGDMLQITAATTAANIGTYKITSVATTTLTINISDNENWVAEGGATFKILRKGMHLQFRNQTITIGATTTLAFADANPDTITRAAGNWISDGVLPGDIITITGSASNNGTFTAATVGATALTLVATDTLVAEGAVAATATCKRGFTRTLNGVAYGFKWRAFGNGGTLAACFQWLQRQLRRATDVDDASTASRGDTTDLLEAFASPNMTTTNLVIDDAAASDLNNLTEKDATSVARNDAFIASISVTINDNLVDDANVKIQIYWEDTPSQFGTVGAVLVQDKDGVGMESTNPASSPVTFTYNYDATQNGHGGGVDQDIVIVGIGLSGAQYAKSRGTISRQNTNSFSLSAALERNYAT